MKSTNPEIADNEAWDPFLRAVEKATYYSHVHINGYPSRLRTVVALALSVAKWHLVINRVEGIKAGSVSNCGCCQIWFKRDADGDEDCGDCPLMEKEALDCVAWDKSYTTIYSNILKIYIKHFNALSEEDKQRLA